MIVEKKSCKFNLAKFAENLHVAQETSDHESEKELKESFEEFIHHNDHLKESSFKYLKTNKYMHNSKSIEYLKSLSL